MTMNEIKAWCEARGYRFTRGAERAFARRLADGEKISATALGQRHQALSMQDVDGDRSAIELLHQAAGPQAQMRNLNEVAALEEARKTLRKIAVSRIGEAELERQIKFARYLEEATGPEADAARAQHEIDIKESNATPLNEEDLRSICIDVMGAPAQQMHTIIKHRGKVRAGSKRPSGNLIMTSPLNAVVNWMPKKDQYKTLMLSGPAMTGKTTAALFALYWDAVNVNSRIRVTSFYSAYQIARIAGSNYQDSIDLQDKMYHAPFLIIDNLMPVDMMTSRNPKQFVGFIIDLFDQRQSCGHVTIVTSTMSLSECKSQYSSSIATHFQPPRGFWREHRQSDHHELTDVALPANRPSMQRIKE